MTEPKRKRDGAAVLVLVVMFAIITAMLGVWAKSITLQHRHMRARGYATQARWLAESGLRRAVARRAAEPDYSGETWLIAPDTLSGRNGGRVEIVVEASSDRPDALRITARAIYPDNAVRRVQQSEWIEIPKESYVKVSHRAVDASRSPFDTNDPPGDE